MIKEALSRPTDTSINVSPCVQPSLSEYWKVGDPNEEKPLIWEELKDDLNPRWVATKIITLNPDFAIVTNADENRHTATVLILPNGLEVFDSICGDPRFAALSNAYNGSTEPNLQVCESWNSDIKESVGAWYSYRQRQSQARGAEDHQIISQPETYKGVHLPTAYDIKEVVLDVINKPTASVQTQQPEPVKI